MVYLSIVIPIYNAKDFLGKCVNSIVALNFSKDYEIILVDDGSSDGSSELCDQLCLQRKEIKVIHQKNQGVSSARNAGIKMVKGKWIWFVDADDIVEKNSQNNELTLELQNEQFAVMDCIWDEYGVKQHYETTQDTIPYNLWRCCFRKDVITKNNLKFVINRKYAEDQEFILKYLLYLDCNSQRKVIKSAVYHYYVRKGSAMTKKGVNAKHLTDLTKVFFFFLFHSVKTGNITQKWVWMQQKRMVRAIFNVLIH